MRETESDRERERCGREREWGERERHRERERWGEISLTLRLHSILLLPNILPTCGLSFLTNCCGYTVTTELSMRQLLEIVLDC